MKSSKEGNVKKKTVKDYHSDYFNYASMTYLCILKCSA